MQRRYDIFTEVLVVANGREEVRRIAHLQPGRPNSRAVPVLQQGELVTYSPNGTPWIYRALK
jgi:hypothetical protein